MVRVEVPEEKDLLILLPVFVLLDLREMEVAEEQ